jgi:nucleotide sugar dehydrogenase
MKVGVIGLGKVGIPFALLCKESGLSVVVSDNDEELIYNLNQNVCLTSEPYVQRMLFEQQGITTSDPIEIITNSDIIFTFIETLPFLDGNIDTSVVFEVANLFFDVSKLDIPLYEKKFVICTTTNPGDVEQIQKKLDMFNIQVAYHPVLSENGEIVSTLKNSDLLLIGTNHQQIFDNIIQIYQKIQNKSINAFMMDTKSAEVAKLAISSFVSIKNTFANMVGNLMTNLGIDKDINLVLNAMGGDSRIGDKEFKYSFGFGGPIISRDNKALNYILENSKTDVNLISKIDDLNKLHLDFLKKKYVNQNPDKSIPFVINGLSYKKNTNILESSQQYQLCLDLLNEGYTINVVEDPLVSSKLNSLSESYNGRLKFFKVGSKVEGFLIDIP